jgi:predicted regulator of Ras-like GTPase activity (Roadblock/LC7/MglB family)
MQMRAGRALVEALGEIARGNGDVSCAFVVDDDGKVSAAEGAPAETVAAAVAMVVPLRALLDRATAELGAGQLAATVIEGDRGVLALADVDGARTVVVLGAHGAAPGALRADAAWVAERIRLAEVA